MVRVYPGGKEQTLIDVDRVLARLNINDRVVAERRLEDKRVVAAEAPKNVILPVIVSSKFGPRTLLMDVKCDLRGCPGELLRAISALLLPLTGLCFSTYTVSSLAQVC